MLVEGVGISPREAGMRMRTQLNPRGLSPLDLGVLSALLRVDVRSPGRLLLGAARCRARAANELEGLDPARVAVLVVAVHDLQDFLVGSALVVHAEPKGHEGRHDLEGELEEVRGSLGVGVVDQHLQHRDQRRHERDVAHHAIRRSAKVSFDGGLRARTSAARSLSPLESARSLFLSLSLSFSFSGGEEEEPLSCGGGVVRGRLTRGREADSVHERERERERKRERDAASLASWLRWS